MSRSLDQWTVPGWGNSSRNTLAEKGETRERTLSITATLSHDFSGDTKESSGVASDVPTVGPRNSATSRSWGRGPTSGAATSR